jgi:hypothetical protein
MTYQKATRRQAKLKLAITGPSGSGKTFSALLIAAGIGGKIAVIDTENGSASLYADVKEGPLAGIEFDTLEIAPPYTIDKYLTAIDMAEKAGYNVLIPDSISHAWAGEGGLLDKKGALDARGGNTYTNWNTITPEQERFKARILQADLHIICTMRSKQDYVLEQNEKGKSVPRKVGLAPIQRDGMEYEFTTVFDLGMDHNAAVSKDRTSLFDGKIFKPSRKTGEQLMAWLKEGKAMPKPSPKPEPTGAEFPEGANGDQVLKIKAGFDVLQKTGIREDTIWEGIRDYIKKATGGEIADTAAMTPEIAETVITYLDKWAEHIKQSKKRLASKKTAAQSPAEGDF